MDKLQAYQAKFIDLINAARADGLEVKSYHIYSQGDYVLLQSGMILSDGDNNVNVPVYKL